MTAKTSQGSVPASHRRIEILSRSAVIYCDEVASAQLVSDFAEPFLDLKADFGNLAFAELDTAILKIRSETRRQFRARGVEQPFKVSTGANVHIKFFELTVIDSNSVNWKSVKQLVGENYAWIDLYVIKL